MNEHEVDKSLSRNWGVGVGVGMMTSTGKGVDPSSTGPKGPLSPPNKRNSHPGHSPYSCMYILLHDHLYALVYIPGGKLQLVTHV